MGSRDIAGGRKLPIATTRISPWEARCVFLFVYLGVERKLFFFFFLKGEQLGISYHVNV